MIAAMGFPGLVIRVSGAARAAAGNRHADGPVRLWDFERVHVHLFNR